MANDRHVRTDDPDTVAACPECDRCQLRHRTQGQKVVDGRPREGDADAPYRCTNCTARVYDYIERPPKAGGRPPERSTDRYDLTQVEPDELGLSPLGECA